MENTAAMVDGWTQLSSMLRTKASKPKENTPTLVEIKTALPQMEDQSRSQDTLMFQVVQIWKMLLEVSQFQLLLMLRIGHFTVQECSAIALRT